MIPPNHTLVESPPLALEGAWGHGGTQGKAAVVAFCVLSLCGIQEHTTVFSLR